MYNHFLSLQLAVLARRCSTRSSSSVKAIYPALLAGTLLVAVRKSTRQTTKKMFAVKCFRLFNRWSFLSTLFAKLTFCRARATKSGNEKTGSWINVLLCESPQRSEMIWERVEKYNDSVIDYQPGMPNHPTQD